MGTGTDANEGRGRGATSPTEIPAAGWKDILWRVYNEISDDRVMLVAAGVTYYVLLALVPAMSALISIYGLFFDPASVNQQVTALQGVVPGGGIEIIQEQLKRLTAQPNTTLGITSIVSLLIALWSANAGMKSLIEAMNVAYDQEDQRSFVRLTLLSFSFTLGAIVILILFMGIIIVLPNILDDLGLKEATQWIVQIASFLLLFLIAFGAIAVLYRWGPSRENAQWKWLTPGAILTTVVTAIVSILFSWYAANFGSYNATYGSLGALIGFMTWIWISMTILIIGGELNSEMEHQTAKDTTTGPPQPMGSRGAVMADTVGRTVSGEEYRAPAERARTERGARRRERISWGTLAFALPAAGLLAYMQSRRRR